MGIINENDKFHFYKYIVKEIYILINGESISLGPERVNSFSIMDDYLGNLYPIVKLDLGIEQSLYYKIQSNKDSVKFKLNIQMFYRVNTLKTKKSINEVFVNDIFQLILDDETDDLGEEIRKKEFPGGELDNPMALTTTMEFFLFKSDVIRNNRTIVNHVFHNCTVTQALIWLLMKGKIKKVLMHRANNGTFYDELIVPPLSIGNAFRYIDTFYGIYKTGTVIYFGIDRAYILPFLTRSSTFAKEEKEDVTIIVPKIGSTHTDNICQVKKVTDDECYMITDPKSFSVETQDKTQDILSAKEITVVDASSSSTTTEKNREVIVRAVENPYLESIYKAIKKSNEIVIRIFLEYVDVRMLTPNKRYRFVFEDTRLSKKYKGTYILCEKTVSLVKEGKEFIGGVTASFRRI